MKFLCRKLRRVSVSYTIGTELPEPRNGAQAMLVPVESQHETKGGIVEIHVWTFLPSPFEEGKCYEMDPSSREYMREVVEKLA